LLTPAMAAALGAVHVNAPLRITPWRSVVVGGGADRAEELADAGLVTAPDAPWTVLTACAGAPSCGRTTTSTRDLARAAAPFVDPAGPRCTSSAANAPAATPPARTPSRSTRPPSRTSSPRNAPHSKRMHDRTAPAAPTV